MVFYDRVWRYREGLIAGSLEPELSEEERDQVSRLLWAALNILGQYGGTEPARLARMCHDYQASTRVNECVARIITSV